MRIRLDLPEPGLWRAARWCLVGSFLLILGFFILQVYGGIWQWGTGPGPRIDLPRSTRAEEDREPSGDRVIFYATREGRIWHAGNFCDLTRIGIVLREAAVRYTRKLREQGKPESEELRGGPRASKLGLLLLVDRAAPWGAVHDVMRVAGQHGIYRIQFDARGSDGWRRVVLDAFLPYTDDGSRMELAVRIRQAGDGTPLYPYAGTETRDAMALRTPLHTGLEEHADQWVVGSIHPPAISHSRRSCTRLMHSTSRGSGRPISWPRTPPELRSAPR